VLSSCVAAEAKKLALVTDYNTMNWETILGSASMSDDQVLALIDIGKASLLAHWPRATMGARLRVATMVTRLETNYLRCLLDSSSHKSATTLAFCVHAMQTLGMFVPANAAVIDTVARDLMEALALHDTLAILDQLRARAPYAAILVTEACSRQDAAASPETTNTLWDFITDTYLLPALA
jgi:hypothetical protein